nr:RING-H2 finger protein ATL18 [Ipomoea batatas]
MQRQSPISTATIILYTCIWIPFLQIKQVMAKMIRLVWCEYQYHEAGDDRVVLELDAIIFGDIKRCSSSSSRRLGEECCSICLVEYAKEDWVNQLRRCGHLFHVDCIHRCLRAVQMLQFLTLSGQAFFIRIHSFLADSATLKHAPKMRKKHAFPLASGIWESSHGHYKKE